MFKIKTKQKKDTVASMDILKLQGKKKKKRGHSYDSKLLGLFRLFGQQPWTKSELKQEKMTPLFLLLKVNFSAEVKEF